MGLSEGEGDVPSFSHLPEVAWVEVMSYLPLLDRYHLSQTCRALSEVFSHPSLWQTVNIHFTANYNIQESFVFKRYYHMVKKFGHCFQNLKLSISGHFCSLPDEWEDTLHELGERCRLESLTLEVGMLTSLFHLHGYEPFKQDVRAVLSTIRNAFRLKKFHLKSWPMYPPTINDPDQNVFTALIENEKLKNLESLTLFWAKATEWTERQPILPSPDYTLDIVKHFRNLTQLGLRSPMLNDNIVLELSSPGRTKLDYLQIFCNFSKYNRDYEIPKISSDTWRKLVKHSPSVEVEITLMSRIPSFNLAYLLKPETPTGVINVMKYSHCDSGFVESLTQKYAFTLRSFVCYCDASSIDSELLNMVTKCDKLRTFIYHGHISYTTVVLLAARRCQDWLKFEVVGDMITTETTVSEFNDDDEVIAKGGDGEYYLCSVIKMHEQNEKKDVKLTKMATDVSTYLGYKWRPF